MASKNVILSDKDGNQLLPATTADQVRYDENRNVKQAIMDGATHATTANLVEDMTNTDKIYVYTGSESGYTAGDWYYYDGSAWVSGGSYTDGTQFETDTTLSVSGKAADAKATGDKVTELKSAMDSIIEETAPTAIYEGENVSGTFPSATSTYVVIASKYEISPNTLYTLIFDGIAVVDNNGDPIADVSDYGVRIYQYASADGSSLKTLSYYNARAGEQIEFTSESTAHYTSIVLLAKTSGKKDYVISAEFVGLYAGEYYDPTIALKTSVDVPQVLPLIDRLDEVTYSAIPDYYNYNDYFNNRISEIINKAETVGNHGDSFIFFSDYHYPNNAHNSPALIAEIQRQVPAIQRIVFGGDVLNSHIRAAALIYMKKFADEVRLIDPIMLFGNHELNTMGNDHESQTIGLDTAYMFLGKKNELVTDDTHKDWYFVFKNTTQKIVYIVLDTGTNGSFGYVSPSISEYDHQVDQRRWLLNTLHELEDGYSVLVLGHWFFTGDELTPNGGVLLKGILDAVHNKATYSISSEAWDFSGKDITVIGALCGHTHKDVYVQDTGSYPIIAITTDSYGVASDSELLPDTSKRNTNAKGTIYEQAFDIVQIDTDVRKIYMTRVGYGSDRVFDY